MCQCQWLCVYMNMGVNFYNDTWDMLSKNKTGASGHYGQLGDDCDISVQITPA